MVMMIKKILFPIIFLVFTSKTIYADTGLFQQVASDIQEPELAIIESLENGESYSIEITSVGCFNGTRQTITISKENDILKASFQDTVKVLSDLDVEAFKTFEFQLQTLEMGGCTTVDTYVVSYRNQTFSTSDGTCSWNGGKKLLQAIS